MDVYPICRNTQQQGLSSPALACECGLWSPEPAQGRAAGEPPT